MKILLSAFACIPNVGSEGGVGWKWAHEWAQDHEVVVVTDITRRAAIEAELLRHPATNPRFVYFRPPWLRGLPLNSWTAQILYQLWQVGLVSFVRRLRATEGFSLAHHVTYGVFRQPSFLGRTGIPLVFGPVGGGEDAPWRLKRSMTPRDRIHELLRTALNRWARVDPMLRAGLRDCALILVKTADTARALPAGFEPRVKIALEIGTTRRANVQPLSAPAGRPLKLMYAGSLFGLKGMHLGLAAIARAKRNGACIQLTVVGDGPEGARLRALAQDLGIADAVTWLPRMPQAELLSLYRAFDALLFPSLHDSSGNVVMEALSFALPVICFDLGGPAEIVTDNCGRVVRTADLDEDQAIDGLAAAIASIAHDPDLFERLSIGALHRATQLDWLAQTKRIKAMALQCAHEAR